MSAINKIAVDGTTYDIEDSRVDLLAADDVHYSSSETYAIGTIGRAVSDLATGNEVATTAEILSALYS